MKKNKFFFFTLLACHSLTAQSTKFSLEIGPTTGYHLHKSFNQFRKSYNAVNTANSNVVKELGVFSPDYGLLVLGRLKMDNLSFFAGYNWTQAKSSVSLINDRERKFTRTSRTPLYAGAGLELSKGGIIDVVATFGRTEILTGIKRKGSPVSYAQDANLNGSYTSFHGTYGVAYHKKLTGKLKNFSIRAELQLSLLPKGTNNSFTDWLWTKNKLYGYLTELPIDYGVYLQDPYSYPVDGKYSVNNRMRVIQFSFLYSVF